jgi:hypothetical protein
LTDGNSINGVLQETMLTIESQSQRWRVPVSQVVSFRGASNQADRAARPDERP